MQHIMDSATKSFPKLTAGLFLLNLFIGVQIQAQTPGPDTSPVYIEAGNRKITLDEFNKEFNYVVEKAFVNPPTREEFIEEIVRREIGLQEAEKKKVAQNPKVQFMVKQALYAGFLETELGPQFENIPAITEAEMKAYYQKYPEVRYSYILFEVPAGSTASQKQTAKKRAEEVFAEVKVSKRPFAELVKLYTDDVFTKNFGGDVGYMSKNDLVPHYYQTLLGMKKGEVKGLIETQYGFHIVKLIDKRPYNDADKRKIRLGVYDEKRKVKYDTFFDALKKKYTIKVNSKISK